MNGPESEKIIMTNNFNYDKPETYNQGTDREIVVGIQHALERNRPALQAEMIRRFCEAVKNFNCQSSIQTQKMVSLTKWLLVLTIVMTGTTFYASFKDLRISKNMGTMTGLQEDNESSIPACLAAYSKKGNKEALDQLVREFRTMVTVASGKQDIFLLSEAQIFEKSEDLLQMEEWVCKAQKKYGRPVTTK